MPGGRPHTDRPEALIVALAQSGDEAAFAELVRRRQSWIRNLMRRFSGDADLADDLAQQTFVQAWSSLGQLRQPGHFGGWLKRLAVNVWLQHVRKADALRGSVELDETAPAEAFEPGTAVDLDRALATLSQPVRLCIVLAYHEGMTHGEIADWTGMPPGTVKSHIRRGTQCLQQMLADYTPEPREKT